MSNNPAEDARALAAYIASHYPPFDVRRPPLPQETSEQAGVLLRACAERIDFLDAALHDALAEREPVGWREEWPDAEGWWWLYGERLPWLADQNLMLIRAAMRGGELHMVIGGYWFTSDMSLGPHRWARADVPAVPELPGTTEPREETKGPVVNTRTDARRDSPFWKRNDGR